MPDVHPCCIHCEHDDGTVHDEPCEAGCNAGD